MEVASAGRFSEGGIMGGWGSVLKQTVAGFSEDNGTRLAAALSCYTVFSLPPLLILLLLALSAVRVTEHRVAE
jgi:uncharacterized BrkB/YihY/UPF0761 family membrane protein